MTCLAWLEEIHYRGTIGLECREDDLAGRYLCRLFKHMDSHGQTVATPVSTPGNALDASIVDALQSGYVQRAKDPVTDAALRLV